MTASRNGWLLLAAFLSGMAALMYVAIIVGGPPWYRWFGAGVVQPLPVLAIGLAVITGLYLLRGLGIVPLFGAVRDRATPFMIWSSLICMGYGLAHLRGLMQV